MIPSLRNIVAVIVSAVLMLGICALYDGLIDDPQVIKQAQDDLRNQINQHTRIELQKAEKRRAKIEGELQSKIIALTIEKQSREVEINELIIEYHKQPDANDPSAINGKFLR